MDYVVTIFDDQDTRLQYFGDWLKNGDDRVSYLNTTTYTGFAGAGVVFNFTGTSISVYGQIPKQTYLNSPNAVLNYTIDFGVPYQFIAISGKEDMNQQLFFRATGLSLGEHTLVITNEVNDDLLILDYLEVGTSGGVSSDFSSLTTPIYSKLTAPANQYSTITALISSSFTATATHYATVTALQISSESTTTRLGPPLGITTGGAIAGSMIISLILFACFLGLRRRHRTKNLPLPGSLSPPQLDMSHAPARRSSITPFIIGDPSGLFMGPILGKCATHGNGQGVDGDPGSSVPEGVALHCAQVPFSTGGRQKSRSDFPPRCTALAL